MQKLTFSDWLSIAAIIIPSLIAIGMTYWQVQVMKELANSSKDQEVLKKDTLITKLGRIYDKIFFPIIALGYPIYALYPLYLSQDPLNSRVTFLIAFYTSVFFFNVIFLLIRFAVEWIVDILKRQTETTSLIADNLRSTIEIIKRSSDASTQVIEQVINRSKIKRKSKRAG